MKHYEVVCTFGHDSQWVRIVEALDESHARKQVWSMLTDMQKGNCVEIEVFEIE